MKRLHLFIVSTVIIALVGMTLGMTARPANAQINIPTGATINSATLSVYALYATNQIVQIHRVTAPWTESGVTWNNFGGSYDPNIVGSFVASSEGWQSVDVTALVQAWADGVYPNYGFLLEQDPASSGFTTYASSDNGDLAARPKLEICYTLPGSSMTCVTIQRPSLDPVDVFDAYIWPLNPDSNFGFAPDLYTGVIASTIKQSLLQFKFELPPSGGCSLTPGYWKTHSKYGPAPYDSTWAKVGEVTAFFLSGQSWYQVLWTEPAGNAYYILAHAYIAAYLNGLNGADTSTIDAQLTRAAALFNVYAPTTTLSKAVRQDFINTASVLDQYNNGYIGPGHCSE
ncbi:MAG TPA: DNRLRE domain-containing protein [Anaerolineae bacterium]|nr:DNRLRE domain-containing protein [Anaerolineae bacterium]